jgi:hypothetical protein
MWPNFETNSGFFHASIPTLAFGGVGESGSGSYRGKASFDCFTHRRSVTTTPGWIESMLAIRYPPYRGKLGQFKRMQEKKPNFDRDGKVKVGVIRWILGLGGPTMKDAAGRYLLVAIRKFFFFGLFHSPIRNHSWLTEPTQLLWESGNTCSARQSSDFSVARNI